MDAISAPWRMQYIKGEKSGKCVLCANEDSKCKDYILKRGEKAFVMMNLYPYSTGHLMVIPLRHVGLVEELSTEERNELFDLVVTAVKVLKKVMKPDGLNIGINLGTAAGAGVEDHLHVHIVPRWNGDTNFMSVVGEVRVIPEDISKTQEMLMSYFDRADEEE
ncbi:MAG: HIT domain-containing protein [Syntrophales bacterium]|nr:HIT domain-containing protein [Syntrophales bacterium]